MRAPSAVGRPRPLPDTSPRNSSPDSKSIPDSGCGRLNRSAGAGGGSDGAHLALRPALEQRELKRLAAPEVVVERAARHAEPLREPLGDERLRAFGGEHLEPRIEPLRTRHLRHSRPPAENIQACMLARP